MSEADAHVAVAVFENLINYDRDITPADIRAEFAKFPSKYRFIMENWFRQDEFQDNLDTFNERKDDIKSMQLDKFIKEHYLRAYNKLYNTLLKEHRVNVRKIIETLHPEIDTSMLAGLGDDDNHIEPYTSVFIQILRNEGYPVYF